MSGKVLITVLRFFPKKAWSRFLSILIRTPFPRWFRLWVMRTFARRYQLNLEEAQYPLEEYDHLGKLFTRKLKPNTHTIDQRPLVAVSPADGHVLNSGRIKQGRLIQCKGRAFEVADLLLNPKHIPSFQNGVWCTVYLSPRDYHRVHHPIEGQITEIQYINGKLWPVNQAAVEHVARLFCVNERVVTYVQSPLGKVATLMVGATSVGHITMSYDSEVEANKGHRSFYKTYDQPIDVQRGEELGIFHLGSTAIILFADEQIELFPLEDGQPIRLGEPIAKLPSQNHS